MTESKDYKGKHFRDYVSVPLVCPHGEESWAFLFHINLEISTSPNESHDNGECSSYETPDGEWVGCETCEADKYISSALKEALGNLDKGRFKKMCDIQAFIDRRRSARKDPPMHVQFYRAYCAFCVQYGRRATRTETYDLFIRREARRRLLNAGKVCDDKSMSSSMEEVRQTTSLSNYIKEMPELFPEPAKRGRPNKK